MKIYGTKKDLVGDICVLKGELSISGSVKALYFSVPKHYVENLGDDASPFLAMSIMPAMKLGVDISVQSSLPQKLLDNVNIIQDRLISWNEGFHKISIHSGVNSDVALDEKRGVGVFFSGGVDSFYSLINARAQGETITHLILVHGFDIDYKDVATFETVHKAVGEIAKAEGLELIVVKTNLRDFTDPILDWGFAHGGALGAIALLLRSKLHTVYIPSSYDYDTLHPWGSHPDIDPLWATENLTIVHHGTNVSRVRKTIDYIAKSETALKYLRVCWKNERGRYNCGTCPKCVRTMIDLRIAGVLAQSTAFEKPLTTKLIRGADARGYGSRIFYEQSLAEAKGKNTDSELIEALTFLLGKQYSNPTQKIRDFVGVIDGKYNKHRLYKFLSRRGLI